MRSRRAAACLVSFMKIYLGCMHVQPGFFCLKIELNRRLSTRNDSPNDFIVLRNFPGDSEQRPAVLSASFKQNFYFRCVKNYNALRRVIDLDEFSFRNLRKFLQFQTYGGDGLVYFG